MKDSPRGPLQRIVREQRDNQGRAARVPLTHNASMTGIAPEQGARNDNTE